MVTVSRLAHNYALRLSKRRRIIAANRSNKTGSLDPTNTRKIRAEAYQILSARFDRIAVLTRKTIRTLNADIGSRSATATDGSPGHLGFGPLSASEFQRWFIHAMTQVLLDTDDVQATAPVTVGKTHFTQRIALRTVTHAIVQSWETAKLNGIPAAESLETWIRQVRSTQPIDQIAARQYSLLRDMTWDSGEKLKEQLLLGIQQGLDPEEIAKRISDKVHSIELTRARTIVRTEISNAHAEATLNSFQQAGVMVVSPLIEFTLNVHGITVPCPICVGLAGRHYTIEEARGVIPVHPNCMCGWVAVD